MTTYKLLFKVANSVKLGQASIVACTAMYLVWRYLQRRSYELEAQLCIANECPVSDSQVLVSSAICRTASLLCFFLASVLLQRFISLCCQASHRVILLQYLSLKYQSFQKIGVGAIHCLIFRRAYALTDFLEGLLSAVIPKVGSLAFTLQVLGRHLPRSLALGVAMYAGVFTSLVLWIQKRRTGMRQSINSLYEDSNAKRLDILANYEKIVTYGSLEEEINKYYVSLEKYTSLKQLYEMSHDAIELISALFLLLLSTYIISELKDTSMPQDAFSAAILLTEQLKDVVYHLLRDIDALLTAYSNLQHSKFERGDIESNEGKVCLNSFEKGIVLRGMSVRLGASVLLEGLDLAVAKGEKVAVVGPNGSGKSLFIKAIAGLVEYEGSIKIDGFEISDLSRSTLCHLVSYVSQSISMFDSTILDNLKAGVSSISEEKLMELCKRFDCHDLFTELGYLKRVGDRGRYLSGGQRQRVALLRAIVRNTQILIFDGAFNGLDQASEKRFVKSLRDNLESKTVICVMQSLDLLSSFDKVLFFSKGGLEAGSFEELYRISPSFRSFCCPKDGAQPVISE